MKVFILLLIVIVGFWFLVPVVSAQDGGLRPGTDGGLRPGGQSIELPNPLGTTGTITDLIYKIARFLVAVGAPIATLMIIVGAYQMLFAGGSPEKFEMGKKTIFYTVIGYVILWVALGAASIIKSILGG